MSELKLKKLNNRLDALETCLLTMTDLRLYLCKAESKYGLFRYLRVIIIFIITLIFKK